MLACNCGYTKLRTQALPFTEVSTLQLSTVFAFEWVPLYHTGEGAKSVRNCLHWTCLVPLCSAQHSCFITFAW